MQPELIPPCGLYCGVCRIYQATQAGDRRILDRLRVIYAKRLPGLTLQSVEDMVCDGCRSDRRFAHCEQCAIRECAEMKEIEGCYKCVDFPCDYIESFPSDVGRKVILRSVPIWREIGTKAWVQAEETRYRCLQCGGKLFRGAYQCPSCGSKVDVD
jgi:hypothetical protein